MIIVVVDYRFIIIINIGRVVDFLFFLGEILVF